MDIKEILFNCITLGFSSLTKLQESQAECEQVNDDLGRVRNELEICRRKSHQLKDLASKKIKELHQYALGLEGRLKRWQSVEDADAEAKNIKDQSTREAEKIRTIAKEYLSRAETQAEQIRVSAKVNAELMEVDAAKAREEKDKYERLITAIKNEIRGYGDEYIIPSHTLLDELAEDIGYSEAGKQLKIARQRVKDLVKRGAASKCSYVERYRRETAMRFVADAFNGKVESVLAKVKSTNYGKLKQEIQDAFEIVNGNGEAFRDARITEEFLQARLEELNSACTAHEIKLQEAAEQRRIKEQIREEQKAKKEYEKALREAEKEEKAIKKLEAEIRQQMEKEATEERRRLAQASAEEREQLEREFAELKAKKDGELADIRARMEEIEERGKRALSMAQQTKKGHVYIISNIGSFGEHVYKIGLTRRLNPSERVKELGDSSVPFSFDIHALIEADDAPALEHQLHKQFALQQVNKANHRKEFFRCDIATIRAEVDKLGLETTWTMSADAQEYRETLAIEERIAKDSAASEKWINRQLELEDLEEEVDDRLMSVSA